MQLTIDVSEKDLIEFGKETIQREIDSTLKWIKIKQLLRKISEGLKLIDEEAYYRELEAIRESAWNEYKMDLEI